MSARLLMIGLDGADGRTLDRCSADGSLPNLAALRARGGGRRLEAMPGISDDALWASFQYAVELAEHGRYHYEIPLRDGRIGMAHFEESAPSFWEILSAAGLRIAILDVPKCGAPRPINGLHLVDWLVHGRYFMHPQSQPPRLAAEVLERFGPAPPSQCDYELPSLADADVRAVTQNLRASVAKKRAAGLHYLASETWDLFVLGFKETHCGNHAFWDFTDASHPAHDPARRLRLGDPSMVILQDIDRAIGDLVAAAGARAEIVVFSTTDFEPNGCLAHLAPALVARLNAHLAARRHGLNQRIFGGSSARAAHSLSAWQCVILPYNENCVALRLSRRGRTQLWPGRRTRPSARLLQALETELLALEDVETGRCVVSSIARPASTLAGSRAASLPDLLLQCASGVVPRAVVSPSLGRIEAERPMLRPGNHAAGGFLIAGDAALARAASGVRTMADIGPFTESVLRGS